MNQRSEGQKPIGDALSAALDRFDKARREAAERKGQDQPPPSSPAGNPVKSNLRPVPDGDAQPDIRKRWPGAN